MLNFSAQTGFSFKNERKLALFISGNKVVEKQEDVKLFLYIFVPQNSTALDHQQHNLFGLLDYDMAEDDMTVYTGGNQKKHIRPLVRGGILTWHILTSCFLWIR